MKEIAVDLKRRDHKGAVADAIQQLRKETKRSGLMFELRRRSSHQPKSKQRRDKTNRAAVERRRAAKKDRRSH